MLRKGYYFGETDILLSSTNQHTHSVQSIKRSELFAFSRDHLLDLIKNFPDDSVDILTRAYERNERI